MGLKNKRFGTFVSEETRPVFNFFLKRVFTSKVKEECEVVLSANFDLPKSVYLIGIASENEVECLINMYDITEIKRVNI
ncbi:MAG: hypothetical protein R2727_08420 [Bacteroidales bacterium]